MTLTKYEQMFLDIQFKEIGKLGFWETIASWTIDSSLGKTVKLNEFLRTQYIIAFKTENELYKLAQSLKKSNEYLTVSNIENFVFKSFLYKTDEDNFGIQEMWEPWEETFKRKVGDCESLNSIIYLLCRLADIPASNLYCALGQTMVGYHFWTLFYDSRRSRFVSLDATAWPEVKPIKDKKEFKITDDKYQRIDFVFNEDKILRIKNAI